MNLHFLPSGEEEEEYTIFKRNFLESVQDLIIKKIKAKPSAAQTALVLLQQRSVRSAHLPLPEKSLGEREAWRLGLPSCPSFDFDLAASEGGQLAQPASCLRPDLGALCAQCVPPLVTSFCEPECAHLSLYPAALLASNKFSASFPSRAQWDLCQLQDLCHLVQS